MNRDIIIHYDVDQQKIVCCTVDSTLTAALRAKGFSLETPIETLKTKTPDEAEQKFGAGILALLDVSASPKIGIRNYKEEASKWENENSVAHDNQDIFDLAMGKITLGLRSKSKSLMNEADRLLLQAAAQGHTEATQYLTDLWPALKRRSDSGFE